MWDVPTVSRLNRAEISALCQKTNDSVFPRVPNRDEGSITPNGRGFLIVPQTVLALGVLTVLVKGP